MYNKVIIIGRTRHPEPQDSNDVGRACDSGGESPVQEPKRRA